VKKYLLLLLFSLLIIDGYSQTITTVGTDFWIAFPPNATNYPILTIFIASTVSTSGQITSAYPGVDQSFTVTPGVMTQLNIPPGISLTSGIEDKGIHVTSNDPVAVYGLNAVAATTDAYLALPVNALGLDYRILSYPVSISGYSSDMSVVATQDGTVLTVFNHQTDSTTTVMLNQGQTWLKAANSAGSDVTGSRIQSNYPVGVFGSAQLVDIPSGFCQAGDHIVEMMFPYYSWGKNFVTVPLAGRDNSGDVFRIVASDDHTDISINGTYDTTINAGDHYQINLTGYNSISTSNATMVAQYAKGEWCTGNITGDPLEMLIPPEEQFLTNYTVISVSGFDTHWVNVVAPSGGTNAIYQDGVLIPASAFTQIGTTNFYGAQRSVIQGSHTFTSTFPFGVFVYGWGMANSYGYPGGSSMSPVGSVNRVVLSPDTSYGQLNVTNVCLTANVTDNLSNPVVGVLVNFYVLGTTPLVGNGYTDASGNAQYCYTQTGVSPETDQVYASIFGYNSDTAVVIWSYTPPCNNPTTGGTIGNNQTGCGSFTPSPLASLTLPTGQTGTLEYKWQLSTTGNSSGFSDIPASNSASFSPGVTTQTTWYKRIARVSCLSNWSGAAESNVIQITVVTPLAVNVTISASINNVCSGTAVTFTATPTNGGTTPSYQWKVNGANAGVNLPTYSYNPLNGDIVKCILTSSETCTTGNPSTSNQIVMVVNNNLPVSVTVTASQNPVCPGTLVTYTASPVNGGLTPLYQWSVNGTGTGTNSPTYAYVPLNGDLINCTLTSSETCTTGNPASGTPVSETVTPNLPVTATITASANPVCSGTSVTFTAIPGNGGMSPSFQWQVNSSNAGTNTSTYSYPPLSGDQVRCIVTSSVACPTGNPATSNTVNMLINSNPVVTFSPCTDTITTLNAKPIKLKGGIPLSGTYSGPGVNSPTGIFTPSAAGTGTKTIIYSYTNVSLCTANQSIHMIVQAEPVFSCGNTLTDIRDNKTYATVQIGTQCWMAANLNYGNVLVSSQDQRDNCLFEKYCYNDNPTNCTNLGALYQWDELMQYDNTLAGQGFCPPEWHIPTENDWNTLFANYINNGFAGNPLKYSGYSGFNALLSGINYLNRSWKVQNFATFFWSSTLFNSTKAWSHGMNDQDPSVSAYPASRGNSFSVRCVHD
jgi:uncharacterized protein (TIGR02145 family)